MKVKVELKFFIQNYNANKCYIYRASKHLRATLLLFKHVGSTFFHDR